MAGFSSSPDFPLTFLSREEEINEASNVAAANERVRRLFEAMMDDGYYELRINGEDVCLDSPKDSDIAYSLACFWHLHNQIRNIVVTKQRHFSEMVNFGKV